MAHLAKGSGRPILFLHGLSLGGDVFADALARLSPAFACHAPDLPGHDPDAPGQEPATIDGAVAFLDAFLEARGLCDVILVGWSMGATVAWRYLDRHGPGRVAAMVCLDMSPCVRNRPGWSLGLRGQRPGSLEAQVAAFRNHWPEAAAMIAGGMFGLAGTSDVMTRAEAEARIARHDGPTMAGMWASLIEADERAAVRRLAVPMLVIHGAESRLYPPETARWLERHAPQARRVCLARSGHAPHLEEPARFAETLAEFAATARPTAGPGGDGRARDLPATKV